MSIDLEARVQRLESTNRRTRAGAALVALVAVGVAAGRSADARPDPAPKLTTQQLELVDAEGKVRGRLGVESDGAASLTLFDTGAGRKAVVTVDKSGNPALLLRNEAGKAQVIATLGAGGPVLDFCDKSGELGSAWSLLDSDGTSLIGMRLPGEKGYRGTFSVMKDGRAYLKLVGLDGTLRVWGKPELEFQPSHDK